MSGFSKTGSGEDVDHTLRRHGARDELAHGVVQILFGLSRTGRPLGQHRLHVLEKGHVVADADRLLMWNGEREGLGELPHRGDAPVLTVLLRQDVLLRGGKQRQSFCRRPGDPRGPIEPVEEAATDLVLLQHHGDRFILVERGLPGAAALGIGRERAFQLVGEAQIVHDEAARLVPEHPVDAGDRLHQPVAPHGLVDIEGVQARCVEAGEPHIAHQHDAERIARIAEALRQRLPARLVADVLLPLRRIGGSARHHHFEAPLVVVPVVPVGAQEHERAIEVNADAPAHADDHRLAVHGLQAGLEMRDDVARDQRQALLRPDHGLQLRPLGLELLLPRDLLAFRRLLEAGVDLRPLCLVQRELGETALVVDRHRRPVFDRALDVVDADVVAEHGLRVGVVALDRRAGEADERGIGQGVPHVACKAVDEVVLAAVRLVGDHHDVAAVGELRMPVALLLREELSGWW